MKPSTLLVSTCAAALAASPAIAQDVPQSVQTISAEDIKTARDIVVLGEIGVRTRADTAEPTLVYDEQYFQRFEPLTAGDALKRVPSVTFLSDVIESDGARLRGLAPGYTQILINGERVPGSNTDRSFFMDRIPAELISRVEIVRSSSARRTGDAIAGTINIVLRDGYELDGGYARAGALYFDDEELEPSFGFVYGGEVGPGRILLGGNIQGRHNPKLKQSFRYGDSPENDPNYATDEFDNREDQTDTRDGMDYSFNGTYRIDGENTQFEVGGFYVITDRTETERSFEYDDVTALTGPLPAGNLLTDNSNIAEIDQENFSLDGKLAQDWALGKTILKLGYAQFDEQRYEIEYEIDFDVDYDDDEVPVFEGGSIDTDILDKEFSAKLEHEFEIAEGANFVVGGMYQDKDRRADIIEGEQEDEIDGLETSWDQFSDIPLDLAGPFGDFEPPAGGLSDLGETRKDIFALVEGDSGTLKWEAGLRYETTDVNIVDRTDPSDVMVAENDYNRLLPSASLRVDLTPDDRISISGARTLRRPDFNYITPAVLEEEIGDSDFRGNPLLAPETAWGFDIGYERRLGMRGVFGVNVFYRSVKDLIELVNTGEYGSETDLGDPGEDDDEITWIYEPRNVGNGKVYGIEFDLSTDLGFIGLPDAGLFGNFSWLDSEVTDDLGERRFNDQSKYVYNFGFIQDLPSLEAAFGATYRKQGAAFGRVIAEEVTTTYGAELEVFVEKSFGKNFTIRAVGSNLLNGRKREVFNKFDNLDDQIDRDFDEYELESEKAGPVFQIMARFAF
jgi:iron complex outermembrane receptor protein